MFLNEFYKHLKLILNVALSRVKFNSSHRKLAIPTTNSKVKLVVNMVNRYVVEAR